MTVAAAKPHTDAVVAILSVASIAVGRGKQPAGSGWQGTPGASVFKPYAVIYPFPGHDEPASLARYHEALDFVFQLNFVGAIQDQVEAVMDAAGAALVGITPAVTGRTAFPIYRVPLDRPITRDDGVTPPVHYGVRQFHFRSEPTT